MCSSDLGHLIDILLGKQTPRVSQQGHDTLTTFGIGQDVTDQEWRAVVRQLLAQGLLAVQGEYGILVITEASARVLDGSRRVMLRREAPKRSKAAKRAVAAELPTDALPLFERLREWRAGEARQQGVPAYIVFGDATLRGISVTKPTSLAELGGISGIGEKKLEQYGEALLAVVAGRPVEVAAVAAAPAFVAALAAAAPVVSAAPDEPEYLPFDDDVPPDEYPPEDLGYRG